MTKQFTFSLAVLLLFCGGSANAGVIVAWDVAGVDVEAGTIASGSAPHTFNSTSAAIGASGALTLGSGVNPSTAINKYGFKVSQAMGAPGAQATLGGAILNDHYFQFAVDVASGYALDLSTIEMNGEATGTGANDVALLSSIDGFSAANVIASATGVAGKVGGGGFDTDANGFGAPIDLTASKYQNLMGSVLFRIYGYNTSSGFGSTRLRNLVGDDLIVNGTLRQLPLAVVPEPATLAILSGIIPLVCVRRRRRERSVATLS